MKLELQNRRFHLAYWMTALLLVVGAAVAGAAERRTDEVTSVPESPGYGAGSGCRCAGRAGGDGEAVAACGRRGSGSETMGMGAHRGRGRDRTERGRYGGGAGPGGRTEMEAIRNLVHEYREDIVREIEDLDNGVVTVTRSPDNPEAARVLARHVGEMRDLLENRGRIRGWDPLFREVFLHADEVEMVIEPLADGVRVIETSENPEVVKLIQAHARKVGDFLARGPEAVHEPTPLPTE